MAALAAKRKRDANDIPDMRAPPGMDQDSEFYGMYLDNTDMHSHENEGLASVLAAQASAMPEQHQPQQHSMHPPVTPQNPTRHRKLQTPGSIDVSATDTASAALAQYHNMIVPEPTANTFMQNTAQGDNTGGASGDHQRTTSFGDGGDAGSGDNEGSPNGTSQTPGGGKPSVGSDEWHKVRRDNHKEVERRRRETINEGINELAKIVPGCEKNKGSILARAVQFITQLKDNETQNIEKWTLEKLLTEQAIAELSSSCDKLKAECQRAWDECETWKVKAGAAGGSADGDAKDGEEED
ncbi:basic helix-loop-helix protein [Oleoguttula sp. CCFEE 5521]